MKYRKLFHFLQHIGKDPDEMVFEDSLTGFGNRRQLYSLLDDLETGRSDQDPKPVCMLLIGLIGIDRVIYQYGHNTGEELIRHAAGILRETAGIGDTPVRYGSYEFILAMPGKDRKAGLKKAERLIDSFAEKPFFSAETGMPIPTPVAVGVATAPDDGQSAQALINRAETALLLAKKNENPGIVDASETSRLAVRHVHGAGIVGRKAQFDRVSRGFKALSGGNNQFFIVDGGPGLGKTSFIDAVQRSLERTRLKPVRVNGVAQEMYRPYYLIAYVLLALMNRRSDKGVGVIEATTKNDLACLLYIIPQMADEKIHLAPSDYPGKTRAVLNAVSRFLGRLLGDQTLVLLIDDFHLADPASLDLLYELMTRGSLPLFVCTSAGPDKNMMTGAFPLALFREAYGEKLGIQSIGLPPLTLDDIRKYFNLVFPGIIYPDDVARKLGQVTGGNPLFLAALLVKMIEDEKIVQQGGRWTVARLESGYFPESFEQMVKEQQDGMDETGRQFISRVSALGESTSLSMLEGFSQQDSFRVYEIIREAVTRGLMRREVLADDENIRFSGKLVQEAIYGRIGDEERRRIHEEIGRYHEKLYFQNVLPSAAFLVHHFKRSGNIDKAATYDQLMARYNRNTYNPEELRESDPDKKSPEQKTGEKSSNNEREIAVTPLSEKAFERLPETLHTLVVAARNLRLYPETSKSVTGLSKRLADLFGEILASDERISIMVEKDALLINSRPADTTSFPAAAAKTVELLNRLDLKSLTIKQGVSEKELFVVIRQIAKMEKQAVTPGYWRHFARENHLAHIVPTQLRFAKRAGSDAPPAGHIGRIPASGTEKASFAVPEPTPENRFTKDEEKAIGQIIASILGAYNKIKLYPSQSRVAADAVSRLTASLSDFLKTWPVLAIARVENRLLINGMPLNIREFENLAEGFLKLLAEAELDSITFTRRTTTNEIADFLKAASQKAGRPDSGRDFWQMLAARKTINGIFFNQNLYDILSGVPSGDANGQSITDGAAEKGGRSDAGPVKKDAQVHPPTDFREPAIQKLEELPEKARELYLKGDIQGLENMLGRAVETCLASDVQARQRTVDVFEKTLFPDDWRPGAAFIKLVANHVIVLLETEKKNAVRHKLFGLCHRIASAFILFGEYTFAAWILSGAAEYYDDSPSAVTPDKNLSGEISIFGRPLSSAAKDAIRNDLGSTDGFRQQEAYQLASTMGPQITFLLIGMIRESKEYRSRRLAAELIRQHGDTGMARTKEALAQTWRPEEKCRILEVIDAVGDDLSDVLAEAFADPDESVRQSAFRLAERLNSPRALELLRTAAETGDRQSALPAIRSLVKLQPAFLAETLTAIVPNTQDPEIIIACCRAMGQSGNEVYIPLLSSILFPRRRFFRRKKYDTATRVAAAFALAQIPGEKAASKLRALRKDPDARIRQVVHRYIPGDQDSRR